MSLFKTIFPSPFRIHRLLEMLSVVTFLFFGAASIWKFSSSSIGEFLESSIQTSIFFLLLLLSSYLTADFISGFVHFLGDSFGNERTPYIGQAFIFPFRDHHVDPKGITRHDFVETNGNNCLVSLPILLYDYYLPMDFVGVPWGRFFWLFVLIGIFFTNQIHKWAHLDEPGPLISYFQRKGWILSPEHHRIHHALPYDTYFCITTGWWNPLLHKIGFYRNVKKSLEYLFLKPKE
ncbi:kua-ubiquitin conjugating enzyme hybrid localization domain protein [Leptospira fainei serovar Hurstbridge str. BUT 6]|uniref:Kua-ubiquitin conjugating enzyme hybrid localization domain protein n=1 Tax=Leptospira fainei serovar Hurstbridge str. BUT 6 TaxID=1193011 RepID=S3VAS1_9LEPT|nr:fatty acid desaturase CarF family protein [Leptospira fainei]EPG73520.1 kua-ubiquitin conjugating enzyme hybrid localization domain protein [Leptospira fainei serovar Hurstbridge str. BUT 6]